MPETIKPLHTFLFLLLFSAPLFSHAQKYEGPETNGVELMPQFPGGDEALFRFIQENVIYPKVARKNKVEGKVIVAFIIDTEGRITEIEIIQGLSPECDAEVIRMLRSMPRWKPGSRDAKPVPVRYKLPITFRLN